MPHRVASCRVRALAGALVVLAGALVALRPACAQAGKAGWWLRVDTRKTEATGIVLAAGAGKQAPRKWKTWRSGDAAEFDLPADLAQAAELYLHVQAEPDDEDVWFCVFFKSDGVRHFDFDTHEAATLKQAARDPACR